MPQKQKHMRHVYQRMKRVHRKSDVLVGSESPLQLLPFELVAEICILSNSPEWALALARTCKYFCHTLTSDGATSIWKTLRKQFHPAPIPDPISIFEEPAYAAFIFDGGTCENCGKAVNKSYKSYSLKIHLCNQKQCADQFSQKYLFRTPNTPLSKGVVPWIPKIDTRDIPFPSNSPYSQYYGTSHVVRRSQYDDAVAIQIQATQGPDALTMEEYTKSQAPVVEQTKRWMAMCSELQIWAGHRQEETSTVKGANRAFVLNLAAQEGWDFIHLSNTPSLLLLSRVKNKSLEQITDQDWYPISDSVAQEQINSKTKRDKRRAACALRQNEGVICQYYGHLRATQTFTPLPPLHTFCSLPIIKELLKSSVASPEIPTKERKPSLSLVSLQKNSIIQDVIKNQVNQSRDVARQRFAEKIGQEQWSTASTTKVHPVEQVHRRFTCVRCETVGTKLMADECMSFASAFSHSCPQKIKGVFKPDVMWAPEMFIVDEQAGKAIEKMCILYGEDLSIVKSLHPSATIGWGPSKQLICKSCPGVIILTPSDVIGHSHRHTEMHMELVTLPADILEAVPRHQPQIANKLRYNSDPRTAQIIDQKNYGCRHCLQKKPMVGNGGTGIILMPVEPENTFAMSWNGLRSHLGDKHGLKNIRDEDVYPFQPIDFKNVPAPPEDDDASKKLEGT